MPLVRRVRAAAAAGVLTAVSVLAPTVGPSALAEPACADSGSTLRYVVLFGRETSGNAAATEVADECGSLTAYYAAIGVGVVESADPSFGTRLGSERAYSAEGELRRRKNADDQAVTASPQDARSDQQWNMSAIRAPQARNVTPGSRDVVVGVLDSGIDTQHPELTSVIDPTRSIDCGSGRPDPGSRAWSNADSKHGTHVAGVIAAADDGRGVTGVAPGVRLASVRVVDRAGYVHPENAVCGFVWAAEHGVRVANTSFLVEAAQQGCGKDVGSPVPREAVRRAVEYATARGMLTVASLGNERVDVSERYGHGEPNCDAVPVDLDGVLAVSAVGEHQLKAGYSSYGLGSVDLAAPGGENRPGREQCVLSTVPGGYGSSCGTSMAAPHVSGVAALGASLHPRAGPRQLAELVTSRSRPVSCPSDYDLNSDSVQDALCLGYASFNGFYGHGLVDALRVVRD